MADLRCGDGTVLGVHPVAVVDRGGATYEITLRLTRDGQPYGAVGERCGYFLAATARRLAVARTDGSEQARRWPDPDDRFPAAAVEAGLRAWAADEGRDPERIWEGARRYLPREWELFAFRRRDPDDLATAGELRCLIRTTKGWVGEPGGPGHWALARRAVVDAWGDDGTGLRAVLTAGELAAFLDTLLAEAAAVGASYGGADDGARLARPAG